MQNPFHFRPNSVNPSIKKRHQQRKRNDQLLRPQWTNSYSDTNPSSYGGGEYWGNGDFMETELTNLPLEYSYDQASRRVSASNENLIVTARKGATRAVTSRPGVWVNPASTKNTLKAGLRVTAAANAVATPNVPAVTANKSTVSNKLSTARPVATVGPGGTRLGRWVLTLSDDEDNVSKTSQKANVQTTERPVALVSKNSAAAAIARFEECVSSSTVDANNMLSMKIETMRKILFERKKDRDKSRGTPDLSDEEFKRLVCERVRLSRELGVLDAMIYETECDQVQLEQRAVMLHSDLEFMVPKVQAIRSMAIQLAVKTLEESSPPTDP